MRFHRQHSTIQYVRAVAFWLLTAFVLLNHSSAERFIISVDPDVTFDALVSFLETAFNREFPILSSVEVLPDVSATFVVEMDPEIASRIATGLGGLINNIPGFQFIEEDSQQNIPETPTAVDRSLDGTTNTDFIPYGINMVQANQVADTSTDRITVCVLDTGVDTDHPDLPRGNIRSFDYTGSGSAEDANGHGTHVTGTIGAISNGLGVVGVADGGLINIISAKVLRHDPSTGSATGFASWQIAAINECAANGAQIVSMSLGGSFSQARLNTINYHYENSNMLFIAAAGNDGESSAFYPASHDNVISVAAVNENRRKASFSQFNNEVELAAPGVRVWSTWLDGEYNRISGTSMACPHVTGVAALLWSLHPTRTNEEIRGALQMSALDLGVSGRDVDYGFGLVQARAALDLLDSGDPVSPRPPAPSPTIPQCETSPPGWTDSAGSDCSWYRSSVRCFFGVFLADENGVTARDACCGCGGGAAANCEDESGWIDIYGDGCDWYEIDNRCELYGNSYGNDGLTAKDACCACQGATISTILAGPEPKGLTLEPTGAPTTLRPTTLESTSAPTDDSSDTIPSEAPRLVRAGLTSVVAVLLAVALFAGMV